MASIRKKRLHKCACRWTFYILDLGSDKTGHNIQTRSCIREKASIPPTRIQSVLRGSGPDLGSTFARRLETIFLWVKIKSSFSPGERRFSVTPWPMVSVRIKRDRYLPLGVSVPYFLCLVTSLCLICAQNSFAISVTFIWLSVLTEVFGRHSTE